MPRFSLEDLDNLAEYGETATAITSLLAGGATLAMPNPVTGAITVGSNIRFCDRWISSRKKLI